MAYPGFREAPPVFHVFRCTTSIYAIDLVIHAPFCISLANVDPVDVARSIKDLDPETTLGMPHFIIDSLYVTDEYLLKVFYSSFLITVQLWLYRRPSQQLKQC
jgi:hypothetical protein